MRRRVFGGTILGGALAALVLLAGPGPFAASAAASEGSAPADTARKGDLLNRLQHDDTDFYLPDLFEMDRAVADSGLAALDSLGFDGFERETFHGVRRWDFGLNLADKLTTYNRTEGFLLGAGAEVGAPVWNGLRMGAQGGYAFSSKKGRYYADLALPLSSGSEAPRFEAGFNDRVVPFGANRPPLNALRAVVGGSDDQDYLRTTGGWGAFVWEDLQGLSASVRYEAARELSVEKNTDFSLFGGSLPENPAVSEGYDRAIELAIRAGSLVEGRETLGASQRIAGGGFGGDFTYSRFEVGGGIRRYLPANFEGVLEAHYVNTGGSPSYQRLADVGGIMSVRGFPTRARVGRDSFRSRLEVLVPWDLFGRTGIPVVKSLRLQFVPWGDAARVWNGDSDEWLTSAGLGLQYFLAPIPEVSYLRFDTAFPMGPERPDDVAFYLHFTRGFF